MHGCPKPFFFSTSVSTEFWNAIVVKDFILPVVNNSVIKFIIHLYIDFLLVLGDSCGS